MLRRILSLFLFILCGLVTAQENVGLDVLSNVSIPEGANDVWGFVDSNGIEYAIVGSTTQTRIYSLEDPTNPIQRLAIPGANSIWRDMKDFGDFVYVVADEGTDGLLIIDMSMAPETITFDFWRGSIGGQVLTTCHNLYVTDDGFCYLSGCNVAGGGIAILDLNQDPGNPVHVGSATSQYAHDVYVQDDLMYTSEIFIGEFGVYDVSDKTNPTQLAGEPTSMRFTHNAWTSHDGQYLFTTDERGNSYVDAYDISDLNDIMRVGQFQPSVTAGQAVVPHNTHYQDGFLVTSWYTDGVVITDASRPSNMVLVGQYDTFDGPNGGTSGCWGAYPFLPSGNILASDRSSGLWVFEPTFERASYLEGMLVDAESGNAINGGTIALEGPASNSTNTDASGTFATGSAIAGDYAVTGSHPDYIPSTVNTTLSSGEVTELVIELTQRSTFNIAGTVVDDATGEAIPNAILSFVSTTRILDEQADGNGGFDLDQIEDNYTLYAGAWGFNEAVVTDVNVNLEGPIEIRLTRGFKDDFIIDQGWETSSNATSGAWVREAPIGTEFYGTASNPGFDNQNDLGNLAYITGNAGGGAGTDDVDDGTVTLRSPRMDLTGVLNPVVAFDYWFYNDGGSGNPDDRLVLTMTSGADFDRTVIESSTFGWTRFEKAVPASWDLSFVIVDMETSDASSSGHLVEGGIDAFLVSEGTSSTIDIIASDFSVYPNAFADAITVENNEQSLQNYKIYNTQGQLLIAGTLNSIRTEIPTKDLVSGSYVIQLEGEGVRSEGKVIVKK